MCEQYPSFAVLLDGRAVRERSGGTLVSRLTNLWTVEIVVKKGSGEKKEAQERIYSRK